MARTTFHQVALKVHHPYTGAQPRQIQVLTQNTPLSREFVNFQRMDCCLNSHFLFFCVGRDIITCIVEGTTGAVGAAAPTTYSASGYRKCILHPQYPGATHLFNDRYAQKEWFMTKFCNIPANVTVKVTSKQQQKTSDTFFIRT